MEIKGWRYYNHAAVPTCADHEEPDLTPILDGSIWQMEGSPLFAKYQTNFDIKKETPYWFIIKDGPFVFDELSPKQRKHVRYYSKRCEVKQIDPLEYIDEVYEVYVAAFARYKGAYNKLNKQELIENIKQMNYECWAGYDVDSGHMAGWMFCMNNGDWTGTAISKYHPDYLKCRASDAIHFAILEHYLNVLGQRFVSSGTRNIGHETNVQEYKIQHWKFRKAYCLLHIEYAPKVKWIINLLYFIRGLLSLMDSNKKIHMLNSVLKMEEIARECRRIEKQGTE